MCPKELGFKQRHVTYSSSIPLNACIIITLFRSTSVGYFGIYIIPGRDSDTEDGIETTSLPSYKPDRFIVVAEYNDAVFMGTQLFNH